MLVNQTTKLNPESSEKLIKPDISSPDMVIRYTFPVVIPKSSLKKDDFPKLPRTARMKRTPEEAQALLRV